MSEIKFEPIEDVLMKAFNSCGHVVLPAITKDGEKLYVLSAYTKFPDDYKAYRYGWHVSDFLSNDDLDGMCMSLRRELHEKELKLYLFEKLRDLKQGIR